MNEVVRWTSRDLARARAKRMGVNGRDLKAGMNGLIGSLVMGLVLLATAALAVVFAATLAVVMAVATALLATAALAWRVRPRPQHAVVRTSDGHAWVRYRMDRLPR